MADVSLKHIRKVYDNDFVAVHDATFTVRDGEFVVLVGPSGCGKSTTLRMIAGLESITSGTLRIGDRVVNEVPPKDRDIAMVFQNYALYPHMSVFDNMAFGLKLRGYDKGRISERVQQAAEILGLEAILDRKPKQLSGGQRQRVAVGRAIVRHPKVFLFDEPLSNLDAKLRVQMRTEISKLHRQLQATMIYVTHDQVEAMTMGDRIVVLKDGYIQQIAPPLTLYTEPANQFVAGFIGSPAMNFLRGTLQASANGMRFHVEDTEAAISLSDAHAAWSLEPGPAVLGIRPEDLYVEGSPVAPQSLAPIAVAVDVLEPMGHEIVTYASLGPHALVARLAPQPLPEPKAPLALGADVTKVHIFDASTGVSLRPQNQPVTA